MLIQSKLELETFKIKIDKNTKPANLYYKDWWKAVTFNKKTENTILWMYYEGGKFIQGFTEGVRSRGRQRRRGTEDIEEWTNNEHQWSSEENSGQIEMEKNAICRLPSEKKTAINNNN